MTETTLQSTASPRQTWMKKQELLLRIWVIGIAVLSFAVFLSLICRDIPRLPDIRSKWCAVLGDALLAILLFVGLFLSTGMTPTLGVDFFCTQCGKHISSRVAWMCGYCGQSHNPRTDFIEKTFLQTCRRCKKVPTAYLCHHCNAPFYLDEKHELGHPAVGDQTQKFPFFAINDDRFKMLLQSVADATIQKVSIGNDIITVFALEPNLSRVRIAWMLKASAAAGLRVTGYSNNRQLFSDVAREGLFIDEWESREYLCRMEIHAKDPITKEQLKVDEITYLLHIPKPVVKPVEPADPVEDKRKKLIALYRDRTATDTTVATLLREYETFLDQLSIPKTERDRLITRLRVDLQSVR